MDLRDLWHGPRFYCLHLPSHKFVHDPFDMFHFTISQFVWMWENGAQSTILNICCPDYVLALYFIICVYLNKLLYVLLSIEPMLNSYHHDSWMSNRAKQGTMKTEPTLPNHFHPIKQVQPILQPILFKIREIPFLVLLQLLHLVCPKLYIRSNRVLLCVR